MESPADLLSSGDRRDCREIAELLAKARSAVAFTGAGISTESGIPDFRSPQGIWSRSRPVWYADFLESVEARREYWSQKAAAQRDFSQAIPNRGHTVLSDWEAAGRLRGVITQNIDELHQRAGSRQVLELHGTARRVACLDCGERREVEPFMEAFERTGDPPSCPACGGRLKHATISFGQALAPEVMQTAFAWARQADLMIVLGSSLVVEPAASLPRRAVECGAQLVIINREATPLDAMARWVLRASTGGALSEIDECLKSVSRPAPA